MQALHSNDGIEAILESLEMGTQVEKEHYASRFGTTSSIWFANAMQEGEYDIRRNSH